MHEDQVAVSVEQVQALITDQAPQWASCPVTAVPGAGTVNSIFRIGEDLAARFPLRSEDQHAASRLVAEGAAMAEFRRASPTPAPELLLIGESGHGYPAPWSVQTWIDGATPTPTSLQDSAKFAVDLATLISSLRRWETGGRTFDGRNRGGDLKNHDAWMQECIARSESLADTTAMRQLWSRYRDLPREDPDAMSHTDLIPANLLVRGDQLAGVVTVETSVQLTRRSTSWPPGTSSRTAPETSFASSCNAMTCSGNAAWLGHSNRQPGSSGTTTRAIPRWHTSAKPPSSASSQRRNHNPTAGSNQTGSPTAPPHLTRARKGRPRSTKRPYVPRSARCGLASFRRDRPWFQARRWSPRLTGTTELRKLSPH